MKITKKIVSLLLLICTLLSLASLAACNDNADNKDNGEENKNDPITKDNVYTVTFVDADNTPVSGVSVIFDPTYKSATSDSNGKITYETEENGLKFMITGVPAGYKKPDAVDGTMYHGIFGDGKEIKITVPKEAASKVTYSVKIVDQNGDAVEGVTIQLCPGGVCLPDDFVTDSNGVITRDLAPDQIVDIKIKDVPSGYSKPTETDANGYHAKIEAGETEIEITVTKN